MNHVSAQFVATGRTVVLNSLHLVALDTNVQTTGKELMDAMEIPAPIIRKPTLTYRRFVATCYIEFHTNLSSYAERAGKNYLRDCHTAEFNETRPCSTVFFFLRIPISNFVKILQEVQSLILHHRQSLYI